jgi:hypothetical protein
MPHPDPERATERALRAWLEGVPTRIDIDPGPGTLVCRDVELAPGWTCRVGLYLKEGVPDLLAIAVGDGTGHDWREDPAEGLCLPPAALVPLAGALLGVLHDATEGRPVPEGFERPVAFLEGLRWMKNFLPRVAALQEKGVAHAAP